MNGNYCTVNRFEDSGEIHVMPTFGKAHSYDVFCWCYPDREKDSPAVLVHNVRH